MKKRIIASLLVVICCVGIQAQGSKQYFSRWFISTSYYAGWEKQSWGKSVGGGSLTDQINAVDLLLDYRLYSNWGVWVRSTFGGFRRDIMPVTYNLGADYLVKPGKYRSSDDNDWRQMHSLGASYTFQKGKFRLIPRLGVGLMTGMASVKTAGFKVQDSNEEYIGFHSEKGNLGIADTSIELSYKFWWSMYVKTGLRYVRTFKGVKQERTLYSIYDQEIGWTGGGYTPYKMDTFRSKPFNQFGFEIGIGLALP